MKELLKLLYNDEMLYQQEIGKIFGLSKSAISRWMAKFGIAIRGIGSCAGHLSASWNGGRIVRPGGRIYHWISDHPSAGKNGYVEEGRLVLESIVHDFLPEGSVVHHFNGDAGDNRPENLMYFDGQGAHAEYHCRKRKLDLEGSKGE